MNKILVTGHLGYVGAALVPVLRQQFPDAKIVGVDAGFFVDDVWGGDAGPEKTLDVDLRRDIRHLRECDLAGVDAVVHLASVSNDPIGKQFANATQAINQKATIDLAEKAKANGVQRFVFASSCSIYGATDNQLVDESAEQLPLTEYARTKVEAERSLLAKASADFQVTSLRFGTACGYSSRLRLDLVVNDFVATAVAKNKIELLSSGTAWRPFVHVEDMARAMSWSLVRSGENGLVVNVGSDDMCLSIANLAHEVTNRFPGSQLIVPQNAVADDRSYRVSFERFRQMAPEFQPKWGLADTIDDLKNKLIACNFADGNFRAGPFMRLNRLRSLQANGNLDPDLTWVGTRP